MYGAIRSSKEDTSALTRQGSLRKVITKEHKTNLFGRQNEDLNKLYKRVHQEYIILAEYKMIQTENIPGIYVIPSRENPFLWFGVIFVRSGLYEDGIFRFTILLDEKFPDSGHPKVDFVSDICHPVIDPASNCLSLAHAFPTWNKTEQHIWQVLKYVHWIFHNTASSLPHAVNAEAAELLKSDQDTFIARIKALVKSSRERIHDPPPTEDKHYLIFDEIEPETHENVKKKMLDDPPPASGSKGHSWVLPGSFKPLGRPPSPDSERES